MASPAFATQSLTLATYNIHGGVPNGFSSARYDVTPRDLRAIADVLTTSGATIVAMQEVRNEWQPARAAQHNIFAPDIPRFIAAACRMNYVFGSTVDDTPGFPGNTGYIEWGSADQWQTSGARHGEFGNAVFTSYDLPTHHATNIALPYQPAEEQRACLRLEVPLSSATTPIIIYATHLHHASSAARERQMRAILASAQPEITTAAVFLLGDLNYSPAATEADLIAMAAQSGFVDLAGEFAREHNQPPVYTFPADKPDRRIDYIFASRKLPILDVHTIDTTASDHLALVATVQLP